METIDIPNPKGDELILGPYKEPLKKVDVGFGYQGAISFDVKGKIQCHECGFTFDSLALHIKLKHGITVKEYRTKYGLARNTRLISEELRQAHKDRMFALLSKLTPDEKLERTRKLTENALRSNRKRAKFLRGKSNLSEEAINIRGICPDQLLALMEEAHKHYGHVPSYIEFRDYFKTGRFIAPIRRTFGSWVKYVKAAGLEPKKREHGGHVRWTDEDMLGFLLSFYEETGNIPSTSDIGRGYLPSWSAYIKRFGSIANARRLAGVPEWSRQHMLDAQAKEKERLVKV